jgi:hypothetical protein
MLDVFSLDTVTSEFAVGCDIASSAACNCVVIELDGTKIFERTIDCGEDLFPGHFPGGVKRVKE